MIKVYQHQHKSKPYKQEKFKGAEISVEDAITILVDTSEIETSCFMPLKNLVNSMPRRLQDVSRREGNPRQYILAMGLYT